MNFHKAKYFEVLESVKATDAYSAGEIKNAVIALLVASLFKYDKLTNDSFMNRSIDLNVLTPVRDLINKINELHPINVQMVIENATVLIIKTARSTFGCTTAIAYGFSAFANSLHKETRPSIVIKDEVLVIANKYAQQLVEGLDTKDNILVSNEGCNCVSASY
jgi:hypothetical protein